VWALQDCKLPRDKHIIVSGLEWRKIRRALRSRSPVTAQRMFRMSADAFLQLVHILRPGLLLTGQRLNGLRPEECVGIFLDWVAYGNALGKQAVDFQRSPATIHKARHRVLQAIMRYVVPAQIRPPVAIPVVKDLDMKYRWFNGAVGGFDGAAIEVLVPSVMSTRYRNRKDRICQNILLAVDWNMRFSFVLTGGDGCGHDASVGCCAG